MWVLLQQFLQQVEDASPSSGAVSYLVTSVTCFASQCVPPVPRTTYPRNQAQRTRRLPPADRAWGHSGRDHEPEHLSIHRWQTHGSLLRSYSGPTQNNTPNETLIHKTHNRGTMTRRSDYLALSARRLVARVGITAMQRCWSTSAHSSDRYSILVAVAKLSAMFFRRFAEL